MLYQIFSTMIALTLAVGYVFILFPLLFVAISPIVLVIIYTFVTIRKIIQLIKGIQFRSIFIWAQTLLSLK